MLNKQNISVELIKEWDHKNKIKKLISCLKSDDKSIYKTAYAFLESKKENILNTLKKYVKDKDHNIRQRVLKLIIATESPEIEAVLIKLIDDEDSFIRALAINGLGNIRSFDAISPLVNKLSNRDDGQFAARALGKIKSETSIEPLIKSLKNGLTNAAWALGEIGASEAQKELCAAMFSKDIKLNIVAAEALDKINWKPTQNTNGERYFLIKRDFEKFGKNEYDSFEAIGNYTSHPDPKIRIGIAKFLGKFPNVKEAQTLILKMVKEKELPEVNIEIVTALGNLKLKEANDFIIGLVKNTAIKNLQYAALKALGNIGLESSIPEIMKFIELDILPDINQAIKAVTNIGGEKVIEALVKELDSSNALKLELIVEALNKLQWKPGIDVRSANYFIYNKQYQLCVNLGDIAVEPLKNGLYSSHQQQIIWALGEIGTDKAIKVLIDFYQKEGTKNVIIKKKILTSLSQCTNALSLEIYEKIYGESDVRETVINGLVRIGEKAIPLMVKCLTSGHTSDKIVRSLASMKEKSINFINQEMISAKDKTVLSSILKLIETK